MIRPNFVKNGNRKKKLAVTKLKGSDLSNAEANSQTAKK